MTTPESAAPERFRLLASHLAGRALDVAEAAEGAAAYTNGTVVFVSAGASSDEQRREVLVQAGLLGAGSLEPQVVKALRRHPAVARRYLALEGRRILHTIGARMPLAAAVGGDLPSPAGPSTASAEESLRLARGKVAIPDAPSWFGAIRPTQLTRSSSGPGTAATDRDARLEFDLVDLPEEGDDDEGDESFGDSKILGLFDNPVLNSTVISDFLRKMFGGSRSEGDDEAGGELSVRSMRRKQTMGPHARPMPTRIQFTDGDRPGAAVGLGGALHPEWDVYAGGYRTDWCRVVDFPSTATADTAKGAVPDDAVLRRRLARVGLAHRVHRRRPDGDDLDTDALIDFVVEMRSGNSPAENVYTERRKTARELGVLILLDSSGSANESDADGLVVHDHQRRAAATIAAALEELGDRVALYAFRSQGRHAVHLPAIKTFDQRFDVLSRARVNQLHPSGYTRLGAGIRGAGDILKREAGTPRRLLLVLSDGFPYDDGYEGRYAEADTRHALQELRADGVACLCLSIGSSSDDGDLERVFGAANHASAPLLSDLSPRMDDLFLTSLAELAAPRQ